MCAMGFGNVASTLWSLSRVRGTNLRSPELGDKWWSCSLSLGIPGAESTALLVFPREWVLFSSPVHLGHTFPSLFKVLSSLPQWGSVIWPMFPGLVLFTSLNIIRSPEATWTAEFSTSYFKAKWRLPDRRAPRGCDSLTVEVYTEHSTLFIF